ncbi:MAG: NADPH-dependent FMN reductase [Actinomycetota bacterium]|nr:NADPH-dependent FMN reductase [Actinomycetota bacterium]|tara:strand:- start:10609 stop:11148 length:540 start_codon:yes stop_codon:yes gene_type:complete
MSKILLLAGGTREESRNNKVASYVKQYFKEIDVPCYLYDKLYLNTPFLLDYEDKQPESIIEIRESLIHSNKLIIFSPVFNGGYVSHLKNTLDWLSLGFDNYSYNELFKNKHVLVISSVDGSGSNAEGSFNLLSTQLRNYGLKVYDGFYLFTESKTVDELIENEKNKEEFQDFLNSFLSI